MCTRRIYADSGKDGLCGATKSFQGRLHAFVLGPKILSWDSLCVARQHLGHDSLWQPAWDVFRFWFLLACRKHESALNLNALGQVGHVQVGDVVELFELPAYLENFSGHSAHVLDYNNEKDQREAAESLV